MKTDPAADGSPSLVPARSTTADETDARPDKVYASATERLVVAQRHAVDMQEQLLCAVAELDRLSALIGNAGDELMMRFGRIAMASEHIGSAELRREAAAALTALQFQDMAGQLAEHSTSRIRAVAQKIGELTDPHAPPPERLLPRASPVAQHRLDAGSADLF